MALVIANRVLETSTTSGTGSFTLLGATSGYQSFSSGIGNGNTTYYTAYDPVSFAWEIGVGTFTSPSTLARTTVLSNSAGNTSPISFTGNTLNIWGDYPAEKAVTTDTLAYPPAIGATTPNTGQFTTVQSTVTTGTAPFIVASTTPVSNLSIGGNAATVTNGVYTTDTSTVTNTMLAGSIANSKLLNSAITINGASTSLGGSVSVGTVTSVSGTGTVSGLTLTGTVTGSGNLTLGGAIAIAGSAITSGSVAIANGGTGQTTYTDGQLLIGNTTGNTLTKATLTQGTGISITNGNGSITIASTVSGTVTSVTGTSPVASSGGTTPAISLDAAYGDTLNPYASKTANFVLAAPNGAAGVPTFRAVVASDIPTLNQSTTGSAATLTTPRAIYGNNFDGSAALTQIIASTYGGTGNGFTKFSGPATAERTFTLPNSDATLLYSGGPLGTPSSGTATNLTGTASGLSIGGNAANVTGTVAIANGGTGQTTQTAAFDALSPLTTKGDLITSDGTDNVRFAAGSNGYVLTADSTQASGLSWTAVSGTGTVTSVAATVPSFLSVSGSPITAAGTLAITLAASPTNGQLLIGNGTGFAYSTLTAGSGITITNGAGTIEIASTGGGGGLTQAQALKLVSLRL